MHRLISDLNCKTELVSPRSVGPHNSSISFIPFLNERDALGRLIGGTSRRYGKRDLLPRSGLGQKTQLLSKMYQDSKSAQVEVKTEEAESSPSMDFWRSEEMLPKIKRSDLGLGELKINKKSIKSRMHHQSTGINSARELPERVRIPPIGFYDISKSIDQTKQKQKVALIFEEHKKTNGLESIRENKEDAKTDRSNVGNVLKSIPIVNGMYQIKSERKMRMIENKPKQTVPQKDSAVTFVEKRSYFKRIKSREDEDMYAKYQQAMNHKFNEFREKLNKLKGAINQE